MSLTQNIKDRAIEIGFDLVGVAGAGPISSDHVEYLRAWLDAGNAGGMDYLHRNFEKRTDPGLLMEGAKSVICVALNYKPDMNCESLNDSRGLKVAHYAWYEDYHTFIKEKLAILADFIRSVQGEFKFKICVDSVPLAERSLAVSAGLGFIGKSHLLINPSLGAELLLGEMITDVELEADKPVANGCSNCNACIRACPTGALGGSGTFDARKCISYLTIECKGDVSPELQSKIGDRVFGCDECMSACPYARCAPRRANKEFKRWLESGYLDGREIIAMTAEEFDRRFMNTPLHRTGLARLQRNAKEAIALWRQESVG